MSSVQSHDFVPRLSKVQSMSLSDIFSTPPWVKVLKYRVRVKAEGILFTSRMAPRARSPRMRETWANLLAPQRTEAKKETQMSVTSVALGDVLSS